MQTIDNLETLADRYYGSVEKLRQIAFEHCGIPRDDHDWLVDFWLYERLAIAANMMGDLFSIFDTEQTLQSIAYGMGRFEGSSFAEKCASSWSELVANPIVRYEIKLPQPILWHGNRIDLCGEGGALNEYFGDLFPLQFK